MNILKDNSNNTLVAPKGTEIDWDWHLIAVKIEEPLDGFVTSATSIFLDVLRTATSNEIRLLHPADDVFNFKPLKPLFAFISPVDFLICI